MTETVPLYVNIAALLDGDLPEPPAPTVLRRDDGHALFYPGQVNNLFGDPEAGKTWVALAAGAEVLCTGGTLLIVDLERNGPAAIVTHLADLGAPITALRDSALFRYAEPEDRAHLERIVCDARTWRPTVAVVDSIGELLPMLGLSSNSPDDFTMAHARVLKPLAVAGAAVVAIDHLAKNPDSRQHGASGTAAKRRAIGGTSLRVTVREQFAPGRGGACYLHVHKDRHGGLRAHCATGDREQLAGTFRLRQDGAILDWEISAPTGTEAPHVDTVSAADLSKLDDLDPPPKNVRDVKMRLSWGSDRASKVFGEWRSRRSAGTPPEQGTGEDHDVPRSDTPVSRNGEHAEILDFAERGRKLREHHAGCPKHPGSPVTTDGKCLLCIVEDIQGGSTRP